jgi:hypothetical protein
MLQVETLLNFVQRRKRFPLTERTDASCREGLPTTDQGANSSLLVNALYRAAFGRMVDNEALANAIQQLRTGMSLEQLAENLVSSPEFSARHGSSQAVDRNFVTALYRDGLGRGADPEGLTSWLAEGEKGAIRAKVPAAFASSTEAIERHRNAALVIAAVLNHPRNVKSLLAKTSPTGLNEKKVGGFNSVAESFPLPQIFRKLLRLSA